MASNVMHVNPRLLDKLENIKMRNISSLDSSIVIVLTQCILLETPQPR